MNRLDKFIVSNCRGRMRLRSPAIKNPDTAEKLLEQLKDVSGVETLDINERTGSLLVKFVPELFDGKEFSGIFLKNIRQTPKSEILPKVSEKVVSAFKSREMRRFENRSLTVFGAATVASLFFKAWKFHTWAGVIYTGFTVLHMIRYRKTLVK